MKKIGVYTICKNESQFVKRWLSATWNNGHGADRAYVLDTGSSDDTMREFRRAAKELDLPHDWLRLSRKHYKDFRFDVARNDNLAMAAHDDLDALAQIDMDEVYVPEFWDDARQIITDHPDFYSIGYKYAWNHDDDGNDARVFWYDKLHRPSGVHWVSPVHEWVTPISSDFPYKTTYYLDESKVYAHHFPDRTKSRAQYLGLLEKRVALSPLDVGGYTYLAREYRFHGGYENDLKALKTCLEGMVKCYENDDNTLHYNDCFSLLSQTAAEILGERGLDTEARFFFKRAIETLPISRYAYLGYARYLGYHGDGEAALSVIRAMYGNATERLYTWYEMDYDWTWRPYHVEAVARCWTGEYRKAKELFEKVEGMLRTEKDKEEAKALNFYEDYQWLKDYFDEHKEVVSGS